MKKQKYVFYEVWHKKIENGKELEIHYKNFHFYEAHVLVMLLSELYEDAWMREEDKPICLTIEHYHNRKYIVD